MRTGKLTILGALSGTAPNRKDDNIMLNAFRIAINGALTQQNMVDGIVDEFEDETGVDTGTSTNEQYDSTNDLYSNPGAPGGIDSNTKLILHGNDADSSGQDHAMTFNGLITYDATTYKWGTNSFLFDGSSGYLSFADSADFDLVASNLDDWTIDFWVKHTDHSGTEYYLQHFQSEALQWSLTHDDSLGIAFRAYNSGVQITTGFAGEITDTNWHHIALCKVGSEYAIYKDGTQVSYTDDSSTENYSGLLYIGVQKTNSSTQDYFDGNLDAIRIENSNIFSASPNVGITDTITVPTSAPIATANTNLLLQAEAGDNYGTHSIEIYGNSSIDISTKKWGDGSWYFDGSGDYLKLADHSDWDLWASTLDSWTLDLWIKFDLHDAEEMIVSQYQDVNNRWFFEHNHGSGLNFQANLGGDEFGAGSAGEITDTNWHHIALIKVGTDIGIYKDGTQIQYYSQGAVSGTVSAPLNIGRYGAGGLEFNGYMDEIRIQNSNIFNASPNSTPDDTIIVPTAEYSESAGTPDNMTLQSNVNVSETEPDSARIVIFEEDVDAITVNTDLKAYISKDSGSTWAEVTLSSQGDYETGKTVLAGNVDLTQSGIGSGTNMKYKITTHNNKEIKLHGVGLLWD